MTKIPSIGNALGTGAAGRGAVRSKIGPHTGFREGAESPDRVHGKIMLWAEKAQLIVVARHAELPQIVQEDAGGWQTVDLPFDQPATVWEQGALVRMRLTLLFDKWGEQQQVVTDLLALRALARRQPGLETPPSVKAIGAHPAWTADGRRWVINALDITEELHLPSGACARARATVDLLEYAPPADRTSVTRKASAVKQRTYVWKRGDTVHEVAERLLGDADRYRSIIQANAHRTKANRGIKRWSTVKEGTKINIPSLGSVS